MPCFLIVPLSINKILLAFRSVDDLWEIIIVMRSFIKELSDRRIFASVSASRLFVASLSRRMRGFIKKN